jgi:hypothetical protein
MSIEMVLCLTISFVLISVAVLGCLIGMRIYDSRARPRVVPLRNEYRVQEASRKATDHRDRIG